MAPPTNKRQRVEDEVRRPKKKIRKFKKQAAYHSSSEEDDDSEEDAAAPIRRNINATTEGEPSPVPAQQKPRRSTKGTFAERPPPTQVTENEDSEEEQLDETAINTALNTGTHDSENESESEVLGLDDIEEEEEDDEEEEVDDFEIDDEDTTSTDKRARKKRNDPEAFATSISKILTTKLTTQKRSDPILSRSRTADEANKALADGKLETKARAAIRAEKKSLLERGRVKDVLGLETPGVDTGAIQQEEKRLKKIAQRGVVKLFNAVRAAQVKAEDAESQAKAEGVVGMRKREDRVNEMSKEGFLDLISRGGKQAVEA